MGKLEEAKRLPLSEEGKIYNISVDSEKKERKQELINAIESKETPQGFNIIICRRYRDDKENDMKLLNDELPDISKNIKYTHDPDDVKGILDISKKNVIFVGFYFDSDKTGIDVANEIKTLGIDSEVVLVTSIDVNPYQRESCDAYYQIDKRLNQNDGSIKIVDHIKNML